MSTNPNVSVIIPVYNDAVCLRRLLTQIDALDIMEIIVVDGGSQDDSLACTEKYSQVTRLKSPKGRGQQISLGIQSAGADYIWILHADSIVPDGSLQAIRHILAHPQTVLGCFALKFDAAHPALRLFAWLSRFDSPVTTFGDQGFFFRRADFLAAGGMECWPLLEDVALRQRLLTHNKGNVRKSSLVLITSARRFLRHGIMKTQAKNAWILLRYFCGVNPTTLYQEYYGY